MLNLSVDQLRRALHLKEQIEKLQIELGRVSGNESPGKTVSAPKPARRKMSAAARARMAAAAKARWKKAKAAGKKTLAA